VRRRAAAWGAARAGFRSRAARGSAWQLRNALVYVLFNERKHERGNTLRNERTAGMLDPMSSAAWLDGWHPAARPHDAELSRAGAPLVARPKTWAARIGWKRWGLIKVHEMPTLTL
jgi:hypothetical protein